MIGFKLISLKSSSYTTRRGGGILKSRKSFFPTLVLCALLFLPIFTKAQVSKSYSGTGTESDPYVITTPQQLADFSTNFNAGKDSGNESIAQDCHVRIDAASLNMEGITMQPIGNSSKHFYGVFDGQQCIIYNLTITGKLSDVGLFGFLGEKSGATATDPFCIVKNIVIDGCSFKSTATAEKLAPCVGGICGTQWARVNIENCIVKNSSISSTSCAGGIVGKIVATSYNYTNSTTAVVRDCGSFGNTITGNNDKNKNKKAGSSDYYGGASHIAGPVNAAVFINNTYSENSITALYKTATIDNKTYVFFVRSPHLAISTHWGEFSGNTEGNEPEVTSPYMLVVNDWNLVGNIKNDGSYGMLLQNSEGNDVAAKEWTEDGNWSTKYALSWKKMTRGAGYFAYVYDVKENGDELSNQYTYLRQKESGEFEPLTLTNNNSGKKFYMLSNPYQATKTFSDFSFTGLQNNNGYYKYRSVYSSHDAAELAGAWEFVTDTKTRIVGGEGFAVEGSSNTLTFKGLSAKKKSLKGEITVPMTLTVKSNGVVIRKAYAKISDNAQNGYDNNDNHILFSTNRTDIVEPYFLVGEENIVYNTFASLPYQVPVNFRSGKTNNAVLSVKDIPEGLTVSIVDVLSGEETVLNDGEFEFTALEGDNSGRFEMIFKSASSLTETESVNVSVWNTGKQINVQGNNLKQVEVLNTLGQVVFSSKVNSNNYHFTLNANAGAYLIRTYTDNGQTVNKIVVE
ncbi:MAG: T9SS type A sorting domain-containing protein [Bacteroidales bacterium]|nr:T9SS type A sorting domain-containing protein [Bacteroidales bacterium]